VDHRANLIEMLEDVLEKLKDDRVQLHPDSLLSIEFEALGPARHLIGSRMPIYAGKLTNVQLKFKFLRP
jgi:hypothetical protein